MNPIDAPSCRRLMGELAQVLERMTGFGALLPAQLQPSVALRPPVRPRRTPVFAGGAVLSLLITDAAATSREFTKDVDVIIEILSWRDQMGFQMMLHEAGFRQPLELDWPQLAWLWNGNRVDFMQASPNPAIGYDNLADALASAEPHLLDTGAWIWRVSAPAFLAMKHAAFSDRGGGRFAGKDASHDAQDIVAVLNGRLELEGDLERAQPNLRRELAARAASWLSDPAFLESVPHLLSEPGRDQFVLTRLRAMADWRG